MYYNNYRGQATTLSIEMEESEAGLVVQFGSCKDIGGLLFVDDFMGISDSSKYLQKLIDVVH